MSGIWKEIDKRHVIKAIEKYDQEGIQAYAKSTFLVYNKAQYPAKHIRAMAYEIAFGEIADKSTFSGGIETVRFFERLGFEIEYQKRKIKPSVPQTKQINKVPKKIRISHRGVVEQKNALQLHLNKFFNGDIVSEKTYDWLKTPDFNDLPDAYLNLVAALRDYRGNQNLGKSNYKLRCDFVCESQKIIFEYDERQHFTEARFISLMNYPDNVKLSFNKESWLHSCREINAKDNHPKNRDEVRAFYDSVRDIQASKHGYQLIRVRHGDFDWESESGQEYLKEMISYNAEKKISKTNKSQLMTDYDWRSFEIELQRIRLAYIQWLFHFNPVSCNALDTCKQDNKVFVFSSPYGRSFSLSPAGLGRVYAGGGNGVTKLKEGSYTLDEDLLRKTNKIKQSLDKKTKELRLIISSLITEKNYPLAWEYMQNFWWLRLGLHEFVFDIHFSADLSLIDDVREYIVKASYNKIDLGENIPVIFSDKKIQDSLRYKFNWSRYGMCSYDCGPIAVGKDGFVPFKVAAAQAKNFFKDHKIELDSLSTTDQKRSFAAKSVMNLYDFQILYHQDPIGFYRFDDFEKNKEKLKISINQVEDKLNAIIKAERLDVG